MSSLLVFNLNPDQKNRCFLLCCKPFLGLRKDFSPTAPVSAKVVQKTVCRWSRSAPNHVFTISCQRCFSSSEVAPRTNSSSPPSRAWTPSGAAGWTSPGSQSRRWRTNLRTENGWNLHVSLSATKFIYPVSHILYCQTHCPGPWNQANVLFTHRR